MANAKEDGKGFGTNIERLVKFQKLEEKLRIRGITREILWRAGQGDIIEVVYSNYQVDVTASPSSSFCIFQSPPRGTSLLDPYNYPTLFTRIRTFTRTGQVADGIPRKIRFDGKCILFMSPLMTADCVRDLINVMAQEDLDRVKRLAINESLLYGAKGFQEGDHLLRYHDIDKFKNLKELILVFESSEQNHIQPFGPIATPPQRVEFHEVVLEEHPEERSTALGPMNWILQTEGDMERHREARVADGIWPHGPVKVELVLITRNGTLMKGDHSGNARSLSFLERVQKQKDLDLAKLKRESEEWAENKKAEELMLEDFEGSDNQLKEEEAEEEVNSLREQEVAKIQAEKKTREVAEVQDITMQEDWERPEKNVGQPRFYMDDDGLEEFLQESSDVEDEDEDEEVGDAF